MTLSSVSESQISASGVTVVRGPLGEAWITSSTSLARKKKAKNQLRGPSADWPRECLKGRISGAWTSIMHIHRPDVAPVAPAARLPDAAGELLSAAQKITEHNGAQHRT